MIRPIDLGLPQKFEEFRQDQFENAARIAASKKFIYLLDSPTGTGKSIIAATVQKLLGVNAIYLTHTKQLQDQLLADFPYARTIKGRNNYKCLKYEKMFPTVTAEHCTHKESTPCEFLNNCPYLVAKKAAVNSPLAVLNMSYFLSEANYIGEFAKSEFVIIDECEMIEDQLMSFIGVTITPKMFEEINIGEPQYKTKPESWLKWSQEALSIVTKHLEEVQREINHTWATVNFSLMKEESRLSKLQKKLEFFINEVDERWTSTQYNGKWVFKPIWISRYADLYLWKHTKRVLGMSATILNPMQMCINVGIKFNDYTYKQLPSPFPKENRPIYYTPACSVTHKNMSVALPQITKRVKEILSQHSDDKILIHVVSYKIKDHLMKNIHSDRLMEHSSFDRAEVLEAFKRSKYPKVLVSPSMDRGVDLPYDQCRVVVIVKVPYPDLGDKQISSRVYGSRDGNSWYIHKTIGKLIQMCGRGVRSKDDYAATYILDEKFKEMYDNNVKMFPQWFKEAIIW